MLFYVLRLQLPSRFWERQTALDAAMAIGLSFLLSIISVTYAIMVFSPKGPGGWREDQLAFLAIAVVSMANCIGYALCRVGLRLLLFWNRIRRKHLLWALTHSHVMLVVLVAGGLILIIDTVLIFTSVISQRTFNLWLVLPLTILLSIPSFIAMMVIVPPFALFSYFVIRRTTERLQTLMTATSVLRSGNYAVRVPVVGEDEVAQLQSDFNAMAADLERAMHDLQGERDRVAALLQSRRELIANVSHELRTPVATLRGYLETTLMHWDNISLPTLHHDMRVMEDEVIHLHARVEELFMLARAEVGKFALQCEPTDVGILVRRIVDARAPLIWKTSRIEMVAEVPPVLPEVQVDANRLEQALQNLLHNAVRHTSPGGIVAVMVNAEPKEVVLQVKDTGEGIAPEDLPHIWERFYQTESARTRKGGGTGLGLALVKEWIEGMGGTVAAESVVGQGSSFTIRLPQAPVRKTAPLHSSR
jgi:signal transduction histidine kinase